MWSLPGSRAVAALAAGALAHEITCDEGEYITDVFRRAKARWPVLTQIAVLVTAAHLLNYLPPQVDPYHRVGLLLSPLKGNRLYANRQ
ncbi:hypothetical protein [Mycolicibacterium mucogenicum]|uniref:DUF7427 family protein n=1 Tax=Mycolicibacterium mucogenicum TaxID=56689 RepID=UPI000A8E4DC2|nr:hypothetical protein [Mycolicibacterium mucogenicum]